MKILKIIIHLLAFFTGICIIFNFPVTREYEPFLFTLLIGYGCISLFLLVILESIAGSFPRYIGILLVVSFFAFDFFSEKSHLYNSAETIYFLKFILVFLAGAFAVINIIGVSLEFSFKKIEISSFKKYYLVNHLMYLTLIALIIAAIYIIHKEKPEEILQRSTAVLLAVFPFFNKNYVRAISRRFTNHERFLKTGISMGQLGLLSRIKNFVFAKDRIIATGIYQVTESDYRSTIKVTTALQLARILSNEWNPKYSKLFVMDEFQKIDLNYRIVEKNENGISVIDDDACMYHFGNASFVKNKIRRDDRANMFLLKNEIPIAKFRINEKIAAEKTELINHLDYYGNTLLFNPGNNEDLGYDYTLLFDKIYAGVNETKQHDLLKDLEKKAPTAFFTSKAIKQQPNSLCFQITTNIDAEQKPNKIILDQNKLLLVPSLVQLARKVRALLRNAFFFAVIFQLLAAIIALFYYKNLLLVFGLSIGIALLAELIAIIIIRKIGHTPSHPANLAQSHQAA
jgi:hypothetical protein